MVDMRIILGGLLIGGLFYPAVWVILWYLKTVGVLING